MSTYSPSLRIELITNGTQAGTWGDTTNSNLAYILDTAIAGYQTVSVTSASQAMTYTSGPTATASANQAVYAMLRFTTTTGAAFAVYAPPASKAYVVWNNSGHAMTIYNSTVIGNTTAAGTGITIANGDKVIVWSDATNFYDLKANNVTGTVAIANGGTGQTSASAALNALLPSQTSNANKYLQTDGTNSSWDAISLSTADITGTLAVANGGTGSTTATGARTNLGLVIGTDVPGPSGTGASGTWGINVSGNAATATNATNATNATYATTAGNGGVTSVDSATAAVTLSSLAAFGRSLSANGYQKLPGGLFLQWGTLSGTGTHGSTYSITFPITFPSQCFAVGATIQQGVTTTTTTVFMPITGLSQYGFTIQYGAINGGSYTYDYRWIAVGI